MQESAGVSGFTKLEQEFVVAVGTREFTDDVDYGRSLKNYADGIGISSCREELFSDSVTGTPNVKTITFRLRCFRKDLSTKEVLAEMAKEGSHPATAKELLAFADAHKVYLRQRRMCVMALGATDTSGDLSMVYVWPFDPDTNQWIFSRLFDSGKEWRDSVGYLHKEAWPPHVIFLAVKN